MSQTKTAHPCMSRKAFLQAGALAIISVPFLPTLAEAATLPSDEELRYASFISGATAEELWELAVSQAEAQNSEIFLNEIPEETPRPTASSKEVSGKASTTITVAGQLETIQAVAVYTVSSENRITGLSDAWLSCTASQVGHTYFSYTFLDSNRTLAVQYTATITNYADFSQVLSVYAEFGTSGGRYASASWL